LSQLLGAYVNIPVAPLPGRRKEKKETAFVGEHSPSSVWSNVVITTEVDLAGTIIAIHCGRRRHSNFLAPYLMAQNRLWVAGLIATAVVSRLYVSRCKANTWGRDRGSQY